MEIKVEYSWPRVSVSEKIEIGNIKNGELSDRQSKKVDKLVKETLAPALYDKFEGIKPVIKIKS